jgi:hypothetical protein
MNRAAGARILLGVGLLGMLAGALDPLEGAVIILPGVGLAALGAFIGKSRYRKLLGLAFVLAALGVGAIFVMTALGGTGGSTGRSKWWGLVMLPYPVGWILGIAGAILALVKRHSTPLEAA